MYYLCRVTGLLIGLILVAQYVLLQYVLPQEIAQEMEFFSSWVAWSQLLFSRNLQGNTYCLQYVLHYEYEAEYVWELNENEYCVCYVIT